MSKISSKGMVAYSWTYCGNESSKLKPAFFIKNGCITSGVAAPSCLIVSRSICRFRCLYIKTFFFGGGCEIGEDSAPSRAGGNCNGEGNADATEVGDNGVSRDETGVFPSRKPKRLDGGPVGDK